MPTFKFNPTQPASTDPNPNPNPDHTPWNEQSWSYQFKPFRGIFYDLNRTLPFYPTDWVLGLQPRNLPYVITATIRMYFINLMPAIAYMLDMNDRTNGFYGTNEVILASALAAIVFALFSAQPLTIVGVTGLINLFNYTDYDIVVKDYGVNYLQFQAWMLIWAAIFHFLMAIFNLCDYTRFITDMTSETFGLYVGIIYIQKGVELIVREFGQSPVDGWLSVVVAILFALSVYWVEKAGRKEFGPLWARKFVADYAFVFACVFYTGFVHIPGYLKSANLQKVPITKSFHPTVDRNWIVDFWNLPPKWVFVSLPFGFLLTLLFYFDHNVSSLMAQARQFPVKRPAGFHWDFFLLGATTFVSGLLGLPAPNGLVPQAPVHTESLSVMKLVSVEGQEAKLVRTRVVEQRVSHLGIGLLTLGTMTRPLLVVLGTMPRALFAGVFIGVGWASVEGNGIVTKTLYLLRDQKTLRPVTEGLGILNRSSILKFVGIQWIFFGLMVGISQTKAAIGFPLVIIALIPLRYFYGPKWFSQVELTILDSPTANAAGVMVSIGGEYVSKPASGYESSGRDDGGNEAPVSRAEKVDRTP
ncbi:hypothetical protein CROQUDRAFT_75730 [Cronartium quercuum f. sp. fusiforme G11]|uniref:Bicarbonate transporter-like transmembrane domain-containing protein n=1 Tax=Cronartium quercuum f. sp. fusiforme G11 TaxID=708437 RepID=A0A9P6NQ75_9BASI|nr:hypothetical protein CROQUDRAFT_75730 [Cronartium quercuum f. sp. fusiforme G11]